MAGHAGRVSCLAMPYPCCCREENNGAPCVVCNNATPSQFALTWPSWRYFNVVNGVETVIKQIPTATHILTQVLGSSQSGCCWGGPALEICVNGAGQQIVDRLFVWKSVTVAGGVPVQYLNAGIRNTRLATVTNVQLCNELDATNFTSIVQWSQSTLAGCRSGPYTFSLGVSSGSGLVGCARQAFALFEQTAGLVTLNAV